MLATEAVNPLPGDTTARETIKRLALDPAYQLK
jgi:hypothetical protein